MRVTYPSAKLRRTLGHCVGNDDVLLHRATRHRLERLRRLRARDRAIVAEADDDLVLVRAREHISI